MKLQARVAVVLLVLVVFVQQSASAATGDPKQRPTRADTHLATTVLLTRGELGSGWKAASGSAGSSACGIVHNLQPIESDLVETGSAAGPLFTNKSYEALDQTVRVYTSTAQADTAWARTVDKQLIICMEQQVENTSSMGAPVSVTDWKPLQLPRLAERTAGFRVIAEATAGKTKSKVYLDLILLGTSRTMTKVVFSSLVRPFTTSYEDHLVKLLSQRLAAAAHAPA
jgi:hypothetical protein